MLAIKNSYSVIPNNNFQAVNPNAYYTSTFRGKDADTVEISAENKIKKPKQKMSLGAKIGLATVGIIGSLATIGFCVSKHQIGKLTKLYNKKMQLVNLAEKIDFKEANTVEEGVKFAKDVLKVGEVDKNITLDAINYANRALVDVSNANKGKLFMPKKLWYIERPDETIAGVIHDIKSPHFGEMVINKKYFDNAFLDKELKNILFMKKGNPRFNLVLGKIYVSPRYRGARLISTDEVSALIKKFYSNPNNLDVNEKRILWNSIVSSNEMLASKFEKFPLATIEKHKNEIENALGIKINIDEVAKKTTQEQCELLTSWSKSLSDKSCGGILAEAINAKPLETFIYHEMGHLQDFAKNLKEFDVKRWELSLENLKKLRVKDVDNRWGGLTYGGFDELLKKSPEKFKAQYPDLYEFVTNKDIQQTAGKVSIYAQSSIGEFIADTYAKMVRGEKLSDDVIKLYEKFNGPKLAA